MSEESRVGRSFCFGLVGLILSFILWFEFQHPLIILLFIGSIFGLGYFVVAMLPGITKRQKLESLIIGPEKLRHLQYFLESRAVKDYVRYLHDVKQKDIRKIARTLEKKYLVKVIYNEGRLAGRVKSGIDDKLSKILGYRNYNDFMKHELIVEEKSEGELSCRYCGGKLAVDERFCSVCGKKS